MLGTPSLQTCRAARILPAIAGAILCSHALARQGGGPPPANVRAARAVMQTIDPRAETTGRVRAWRTSALAAREPGRVVSIDVREGDAVIEGQVVARLDDAILRAEVQAGEAALGAARALLAERDALIERAERDLVRLSDLRERQSASENELLDARTAANAARARRDQAAAEVQRAEAGLALLRQRLEDMTIEAPFDGLVLSRGLEAGQWADRGDSIVELSQIDPIEVWIDVPERFIHPLRAPGASVLVTARALNELFRSSDVDIVPLGSETSRTFPVRLRLENPQRRLLPGMSVDASVPTGESAPALMVPSDAMLRDDAGWFVYTVTGEPGKEAAIPARVQPFTILNAQTAVRVISGPLFPGAIVVVEGNERILFPGQPLLVSNASELASPPAEGAGGADEPRAGGARP